MSVRENGKPWNILFLMRDMRHRHAMEKQICQARKMEALGALAHGSAHDYDYILHVISARTELLLLDKGIGETAHKSLEQILGATDLFNLMLNAKDGIQEKSRQNHEREADEERLGGGEYLQNAPAVGGLTGKK